MDTVEFRAMGSPCRIVVDGGSPALAARGAELVGDLERRWSRFLPSSEISDLNRHTDAITILTPETYRLVATAVSAQERTAGIFHPLLLDQLERLGYDAPWQAGVPPTGTLDVGPVSHEAIELLPAIGAVRLPPHTRFDPGGVGKGLAVDLVTEFLVGQGATTTSVELGGDLRVTGTPWFGPEWRIGVADPDDANGEIAAFTISEGAVATSSVRRRRWQVDGREVHHLLDPRTGLPVDTDLSAVSVCAGATWWADVAAKTVLAGGESRFARRIDELDVDGVAVTTDGRILTRLRTESRSRT